MRFLLVDRIVSLEPGKRAAGFKRIAPDEEYFRDHFPGFPVVPGVLVLESMIQLGGRLVDATVRGQSNTGVLPILGMIEQARFRHPVRPGDQLDLTSEIVSVAGSAARVTAAASVNGRSTASAEITYALLRLGDGATNLSSQDVARLRAWSEDVWRALTKDADTDTSS
jgi:3-hydroxyacyl-[acyl-carrier-protein] dehydratase